MKKIIMILAVAAATANVYAGACSPEPAKETAWVYHWKFTGKTTTGKKTGIKASACSAGPDCTVRVPTSLKIQGYTYMCSPTPCDGDNIGFETAFAEVGEVFWMSKPAKVSFYGGVTTEIAHIIGRKKKQAEIMGIASLTDDRNSATYSFTYAGLGKYKLHDKRISSARGNFAGTVTQPWKYVKSSANSCSASPDLMAGFWSCDTLSLVCEAPSVVYGKWSVKFKKSAAKKYLKNGTTIKTPSWVIWRNQD